MPQWRRSLRDGNRGGRKPRSHRRCLLRPRPRCLLRQHSPPPYLLRQHSLPRCVVQIYPSPLGAEESGHSQCQQPQERELGRGGGGLGGWGGGVGLGGGGWGEGLTRWGWRDGLTRWRRRDGLTRWRRRPI